MNVSEDVCKVRQGLNFTAFETGLTKDWPDHSVELPGMVIQGKKFLKESLGLTSCEISINSLAPGAGMPIYHAHSQNEEIYIFIKGQGQLQVDGEVINVKEGTMVKISPNGERIWRNNSAEQLLYIIVQARENSLVQYGLGDATIPEKTVSWLN